MRYECPLRLLPGIGLLACGMAGAQPQPFTDSVAGIPLAALENFATQQVGGRLAATHAPGALLVLVDRQGHRYERAFGVAGPDDNTSLDTRRHLFHIASETKVLTALAIVQLAQEGRLSLDDDIEQHLGGLRLSPPGGAPITIRHLLQHRAGIANIPMVGSGLKDVRLHPPLQSYLAAHTPQRLRPAGLGIAYTNAAYTLLGRIIEIVSGERYEDYIAARLFRPLGMTLARFPGSTAPPAPIAQGLFVSPSYTGIFPAVDTVTHPSGDALLTAHEMGSFLIMMLAEGRFEGRQVLDRETLAASYGDCWSADPVFGGRCLGPTRLLRNGSSIYFHGGDYITSLSSWYILPAQGVALWVGSTSNLPLDDDVFEAFLQRFYPTLATSTTPVTSGPVEGDLGGSYRVNSQSMSASGRFFELLNPNGELLVETRADGLRINGRPYVRIAPDLFQTPGPPAMDGDILRFRRDARGEVFDLHSNARSAQKTRFGASARAARVTFAIEFSTLALLSLIGIVRTTMALRGRRPPTLPVLTALAAGLPTAGAIAALSLPAAGPFVMFGLPPLFRIAQVLWALGGLAALSLAPALLRRAPNVFDRTVGTATLMAGGAWIYMIIKWDLL